jgi:hypothetical protein
VSHDKIKQAARRRMAETGEKYTTARRHVMEERALRAAQREAEAVNDDDVADSPAGHEDRLSGLVPAATGPGAALGCQRADTAVRGVP